MNKMLAYLNQEGAKEYKNYINGEWVSSLNRKRYPIYNPANKEQVVGYFPDSNAEDVDLAVKAAHAAFDSWAKTPAPERVAILMKFADLLNQNIDELAYRLSAEQGKVLAESRGEVLRASKEARLLNSAYLKLSGIGSKPLWNFACPVAARVKSVLPWNELENVTTSVFFEG